VTGSPSVRLLTEQAALKCVPAAPGEVITAARQGTTQVAGKVPRPGAVLAVVLVGYSASTDRNCQQPKISIRSNVMKLPGTS
jgi:hypothetical protein